MSPHHVEEIEHTADWAIRVRATDLPDLFIHSALGMFGLLTDLSRIVADRQFEIDVQAVDVETLLIDWLNELLYLAEAHSLVFSDFTITRLDTTDPARIQAQARGGIPGELFKVIKAATFSGLSVRRTTGGFETDIVFDV